MRVVVTGASGFIGRSVVARLTSEPIAVRAVSYAHPDQLAAVGAEHVSGDLREPGFADIITSDADIVIHLAGLAHVSATADDYQELNVKATARLAEAAAKNKVRGFMFASTVSVYGAYHNDVVTEERRCKPVTDYGRSKLQAENVISELAANVDMSVVVLRLSTAYGAGDPGNVSRLIKSVQRFGPIVVGRGTNLKSLTYVDNIAELIVRLAGMELPHFDVVNVGDPTPYSLSTIVETVADVTGDRRPTVKVPIGMSMAGAGLLELLWGVTGRKPPISRDQVAKLTESAVVDVTHLRDAYGFTSRILLREGIQRTLGLLS